MRLTFRLLVVLVGLAGGDAVAHAEVRGVMRVGVAPIELTPDSDTPFFGSRVDDAVRAYNAAAGAHDRARGLPPGSEMATRTIDRDDLGVDTTMLTLAPGLEAGNRNLFVRVEGLFEFGAEHRSLGLGFYPFNVAAPMRRGTLTPYLSAGGSVSRLDATSVDGETGVLLRARLAGGVRIGQRVTLEVGFNAYSIGGFLDRAGLDTMLEYDPRGDEPPPRPDTAVAGGESSGTVDVSVGLAI